MTTDLWTLVAAAALQWVLILAAATPRFLRRGMRWAFGNRDTEEPPMPGWAERVQRASDNLHENLILFAILVVVVHLAGKADATSAGGALVFLGARIAHALIYAAGIPLARTIAWMVSIVGLLMIASALI